MTSALLESYRNAIYEVRLLSGTQRLVVDQHNAQLLGWLQASGCTCAAWLTAYNPLGQQQAESLNLAAQDQLMLRLTGRGHVFVPGTSRDPQGIWSPEPSLLIPGLSLEHAIDVASEFRQLAILWCGEDAIPRLVETGQPAR